MPDEAKRLALPNSPRALLKQWGHENLAADFFTTLDTSTTNGRMVLFGALNMESEDFARYINTDLSIVGYVMKPYIGHDKQTGEEMKTIITTLILENGGFISTHSGGVAKSLTLAGEILGFLPQPGSPYRAKAMVRTGKGQDGQPWQQYWLDIQVNNQKGKK